MIAKLHYGIKGSVSDPEAIRSLCGRSSGRVWAVETLENRQNIDSEKVNCKFCLKIMNYIKIVEKAS